MLPPRNISAEDKDDMSKEELEGVALAFPDSGSAGNTNTGNAARRCLMKEHLRERLIGSVPVEFQADFRLARFLLLCLLAFLTYSTLHLKVSVNNSVFYTGILFWAQQWP